MNVRLLPEEKAALVQTAAAYTGGRVDGVIWGLLFGDHEWQAELRPYIHRKLAYDVTPTGRLSPRLIVSFRLKTEHRMRIRAQRQKQETMSDVVRRLLGFLPISSYFRSAAVASSQRKRQPVIRAEQVTRYLSLLDGFRDPEVAP